jgi:hypothetical protein
MPTWPPPKDLAKKVFDERIALEDKARTSAIKEEDKARWSDAAISWRAAQQAAESAASLTAIYPELESAAMIKAATRAQNYANLAAHDEAITAGTLLVSGKHLFLPDGTYAGDKPPPPPAPTDVSPWYWVVGGALVLIVARLVWR